jgi:glycine cleavage system regulatory protein
LNQHLARPTRFAWSSRPKAPERAISWLKLSAQDHVRCMREIVAFLEHKDIPVHELRTERPGYVV